ncbi:DUF4326 domain-containing protein [Mycolicibacterium sp.]|uniref:DUF4326 domain-containing protein n=1 Tax=Mycolicibacterium sp. TaxID=2320850 RepID=UPI0037CCB81C
MPTASRKQCARSNYIILAMAGDLRVTSVSWPVVVDERLRLLARLAAHESDSAGSTPSASRVLQNLILNQRLIGVEHLGKKPSDEVLERAAEVNESVSWLDREPFYGRPRKRSYDVPQPVVFKRGVRLPKNAVSVARPTRFGNPWKISHTHGVWRVEGEGYTYDYESKIGAHTAAVDRYRRWLDDDPAISVGKLREQRDRILEGLTQLQGKDLACYCPLELPCHRDVLLLRANTIPGEEQTPTMNVTANAGVRFAEQCSATVRADVEPTEWESYPIAVRRGLVAKAALDELADTEGVVSAEAIRAVMAGIGEVVT